MQSLFENNVLPSFDVAVDPAAGILYVSDVGFASGIWAIHLDGSGSENILPGPFNARGIAFDPGPCGNGVIDAGEECDDGNIISGDGCESDCTLSPPAVPAASSRSLALAVLLLLTTTAVLLWRRRWATRAG